jgi:two-component system phosphate regulon response regulator OmpR
MDIGRPYHLYAVEDDAALRDMLCTYFEKQGMVVTAMGSAEELLQRIDRLRPDLILLDVGLPGMTGVDACLSLRSAGNRVPIILLPADEDEADEIDRLGAALGADDQLGKPFSARELLARVQAVLRRAAPSEPVDGDAPVKIGDYVFSAASRSLHRGAEVRVLNTVEYALLAELSAHPSVPVSRERLLAVSHTRKDAVLPRAVDAAIMRLRKSVEPDPATPRFIQTVRGHGYMFVPGGESRLE